MKLNGSSVNSSSENKPIILTLPIGIDSLSGKNISVDGVRPIVNVSNIIGGLAKKVSATDDHTDTIMKFKIQESNVCSENVEGDAEEYEEGSFVNLSVRNDGMYVCFWVC